MLADEDISYYQIDIQLDSITKINLSPNLPTSTFKVIKELLTILIDGQNIMIEPSTLFENQEWISGFKKRSMAL